MQGRIRISGTVFYGQFDTENEIDGLVVGCSVKEDPKLGLPALCQVDPHHLQLW